MEALDTDTAVRSLLLKPVEALSCDARRLVCCDTMHAFAKAAHDAFYEHHPLVIKPDDVWFCIVQGLANHINQNIEGLRSRIVGHEGKETLVVERADFILGQPNPWPEMFAAFSAQIGEHVGALGEFVGVSFSTSTATHAAAFDVCLMDGFQGYFEYVAMCGCGIPEFTVLGTRADWQSIRAKLALLSRYGLEWWVSAIDPVISKIAETAAGNVDEDFWRSFFRYQSASGGAELTGWIVTLFPYIKNGRREQVVANGYVANWRDHLQAAEARGEAWVQRDNIQGPSLGMIPGSLASAPVRFVDARDSSETALRFVSGMFGVEQDADTGALSAAFGWAVVRDVPTEPPRRQDDISLNFDEVTGAKRTRSEPSMGTN